MDEPSPRQFPLASALRETVSLVEAEIAMRSAAVNEIDFERRVAASRANRSRMSLPELVAEMSDAGATHIT